MYPYELIGEYYVIENKKQERFKAWITKYALTKKIFSVDAEICTDINSDMISYLDVENKFHNYAHGKDWHRTPEEALARVEEMRENKIKSLERQIKKLKCLQFTVD